MIYDDAIPFNEYFTYHPEMTEERRLSHERINAAAIELARMIWIHLPVEDPDRHTFLNQVQFIRMMLNQSVTIKEVRTLLNSGI